MRSQSSVRRPFAAATLAAAALLAAPAVRAAEKPEVIAVVAIDPYADLRSQLTWVGEQVGNPMLAGFAESFIMLATQGKGLAGLDVNRPAGIVITTAGGPLPSAHALVPVKNLDTLLAAVQGVVGPVETIDGVRQIAPRGMPPLEITEKNGWAMFSQAGAEAAIDDPLALIGPLAKEYSLVAELFPGRMPQALRDQLAGILDQASRQAAAQGQPMDDTFLRAGIEGLDEVERLVLGVAIDADANDMHVDVTSVLAAGTEAAARWKNADEAVSTIASPATADGKQAAIRGHSCLAVPAASRAAVEAGLEQALAEVENDPAAGVVAGVVRDVVLAMLDAGGIDAGLTVDTSATGPESPLPAITAGMKIKDGAALQANVKERLGKADALPSTVKVAFDTGKEGAATLHEIRFDLADDPAARQFGDTVTITLAVTPDHAWLLAGGDVKKRLAATVAAGGKPVAGAAPMAGVDVSLASLVGYVATMTKLLEPDDPQGEALAAVAEEAAGKPSTLVRLSARPIDRGLTLRLSADAGALQTVAASTSAQAQPAPRIRPAVPLRPAAPSNQLEQDDAPSLAP
ncbi:MAG: hypothetical protein ACKOC8_09450 [Pirellulales bacterium]